MNERYACLVPIIFQEIRNAKYHGSAPQGRRTLLSVQETPSTLPHLHSDAGPADWKNRLDDLPAFVKRDVAELELGAHRCMRWPCRIVNAIACFSSLGPTIRMLRTSCSI